MVKNISCANTFFCSALLYCKYLQYSKKNRGGVQEDVGGGGVVLEGGGVANASIDFITVEMTDNR